MAEPAESDDGSGLPPAVPSPSRGAAADARAAFVAELQALEEQALGGLDLVVEQTEHLREAIVKGDRVVALQVIDDDDRVDGRYLEVRQSLLSLMARQAPVASDLRLVAALLQLVNNMERMGDQCVNVAKLLPEPDARPDGHMLGLLEEMCLRSAVLVAHSRQAFAARDLAEAEALPGEDDAIDDLNRECFRRALEVGADPDRREAAMHMMLAARCFERLADNAVDIGEQTAFVVSGLFREFTDASRPRGAAPGTAPAG